MALMSIRIILALFLCAATSPAWAQAGDPAAGQAKSATCVACHGADGNSTNPEWPKLAGQHAAYLVKALKAYKSGTRTDPLMGPQVMALNEDDMNNLAAYFAAQTQK